MKVIYSRLFDPFVEEPIIAAIIDGTFYEFGLLSFLVINKLKLPEVIAMESRYQDLRDSDLVDKEGNGIY